jgi:predicted RNA polymerase sigma factor
MRAWLVTVAWRAFLDQVRSDAARTARQERLAAEPEPGTVPQRDDTLALYFLCTHPVLTSASAIALTLRAVAGLTTRQIADAFLVPEATMAQRISRAKQRLVGIALDQPGDLSRVLRVLYVVFNEGYSGEIDLADEAIRVTRQLAVLTDEPEVQGLLALMLLSHARRPARVMDGRLVPLAEQDRTLWDVDAITEGVDILQAALARDRLGQYQAQAAIAALHADPPTAAQTDWVQIVEWYDELLALGESPIIRLGRAVAIGEADGPRAGLAALQGVNEDVPRYYAALAYLHERAGEREAAAVEYAEAARRATSTLEQQHLTRQAERLRTRQDPR